MLERCIESSSSRGPVNPSMERNAAGYNLAKHFCDMAKVTRRIQMSSPREPVGPSAGHIAGISTSNAAKCLATPDTVAFTTCVLVATSQLRSTALVPDGAVGATCIGGGLCGFHSNTPGQGTSGASPLRSSTHTRHPTPARYLRAAAKNQPKA